jgi:glycosyltransferase involved in cell wall biosynthesis
VSLYAAWACRRSAVPYTVRPHGSLDPFDLRKHSLAKRLYGPLVVRPFLGGAAAVVLTSQLEANRVVTFGASPPKVVIPLPIVGSEVHADGREFRERHGIPANATVVLFLGRVDPKKGLQFLVPSLAELKRSHPDLWFVLAGDGRRDEVAVVDAMLQAHDMAGWTVRCGFIGGREKQGALVASDLFALPSLNENFGIAVVEAMQAGLPVVISDEVYLHTELNAAGAAVVCRPAMSSCKDALESLLADSDLRRAMGARAREAASALFDPNVVLPQLLQLYRTISAADVANIDPTG